MAVELQGIKLGDMQQLSNTPTPVYVGTNKKTYVKEILIHNVHTTFVTVKLYYVADNAGQIGTATPANRLINLVIAANDTVNIWYEYPLILSDINDAIFGEADVANRINVLLLGDREV